MFIWCRAGAYRFQSTPPARGATELPEGVDKETVVFQSTPPARGAT